MPAIRATALAVHALKGKASTSTCHRGSQTVSRTNLRGPADSRNFFSEVNNGDLESQTRETWQDPLFCPVRPADCRRPLTHAITWIRQWVVTEATAPTTIHFRSRIRSALMSGNFYGGHMAFRHGRPESGHRFRGGHVGPTGGLLVDPLLNRGTPADLVRVTGRPSFFNHGFKAMSLSTSALCAQEALKLTMPAASFSAPRNPTIRTRSVWGPSRRGMRKRICTLTERGSGHSSSHDGPGLRNSRGGLDVRPCLVDIITQIRSLSKAVLEDRELDEDIERLARANRRE